MKKKILSIILSLAVSFQCLCFNVNAETGTDINSDIRAIDIDFSDVNEPEIELYEGEQVQLVIPEEADMPEINYIAFYALNQMAAVSHDLKLTGISAGDEDVTVYIGYKGISNEKWTRIRLHILKNDSISAENRAELDKLNKLDGYYRRKMELVGVLDEDAPRLDLEKVQEIIDTSESYEEILMQFNKYHGYADVIPAGGGFTTYTYWFDPKGNESMRNTDKPLLIAVPTHRLKMEVYIKALDIGVEKVAYTPEMPEFSDELMSEIEHLYSIGAGVKVLSRLREMYVNMKKNHPDYEKLGEYLDASACALHYAGNIITTHERFLYIPCDDEIFKTHTVIIDEDILRAVYSTCTVNKIDILNARHAESLENMSLSRLDDILSSSTGFKCYNDKAGTTVDDDIIERLSDVRTNVLDLLRSKVMHIGEESVTFIKENRLPQTKLIIMSATADADVYRLLLRNRKIIEYQCKKAKYMGKIIQYTNHTYSRCCMRSNDEIIDYLKKEVGNDVVITFKEFESMFSTSYHYGNTEGINCLEGKNISVIGLPNVNDIVYKLYALLAHEYIGEQMHSMRIQHNGYDFSMHTFSSTALRTIQIWLIESLLEQAVGRARLLRYDCTVKVFAGFPIEQAEFGK